MKTLYLLRHAKSSWKDPTLEDHQRPLNKRGRRACRTMAALADERLFTETIIYSSTARRTRETLERISEAAGRPFSAVEYCEVLYCFSWQTLMPFLCALNPTQESVCLVGHNPALLDLARVLANFGEDNFPTGALLKLELPEGQWRDLDEGRMQIGGYWFPRQLQASQ